MKMPVKPIENNMLAPCGVNCKVCYRHCNRKKPCEGCRSVQDKPEHCRKCKIKGCIMEKGISFCFECSEFPCKKMKALEKSYQTRYAESLIENGRFVKDNGIPAFMEQQKKRFTCPRCGGVISLHDFECSECRRRGKE